MKSFINVIASLIFVRPLKKDSKPLVKTREQIISTAKEILNSLRQFKKSYFESRSLEENQKDPMLKMFRHEYNSFRTFVSVNSISECELDTSTPELNEFGLIASL